MIVWQAALAILKAFWKAHWKNILIVIGALVLFFGARWYILDAIEKHDAAIVAETEARKDAEWQEKINKERLEFLEKVENVRKKNRNLERNKPRNQRDTIDLLRRHGLNGAV